MGGKYHIFDSDKVWYDSELYHAHLITIKNMRFSQKYGLFWRIPLSHFIITLASKFEILNGRNVWEKIFDKCALLPVCSMTNDL